MFLSSCISFSSSFPRHPHPTPGLSTSGSYLFLRLHDHSHPFSLYPLGDRCCCRTRQGQLLQCRLAFEALFFFFLVNVLTIGCDLDALFFRKKNFKNIAEDAEGRIAGPRFWSHKFVCRCTTLDHQVWNRFNGSAIEPVGLSSALLFEKTRVLPSISIDDDVFRSCSFGAFTEALDCFSWVECFDGVNRA